MCPPEDVGGPTGYTEMLRILADRRDEDYEHTHAWAGQLTEFDQSVTDELIRRTVGQVPPSVRLVLELAHGGVTLTAAGRLPRVFVRAVQTHRPGWAWDHRPAMREQDLPPLAALHDLLRDVGLLRLSHGVLSPTRAARDELETIRRLRSFFTPDDGFTSTIAGVAIAALAHHGPQPVAALAERVYPWVEHGWTHHDRSPLTHRDVERELHRLSVTAEGLDLITACWDTGSSWSGGPCATTLLHRATALAHLWALPRYRVPDEPTNILTLTAT